LVSPVAKECANLDQIGIPVFLKVLAQLDDGLQHLSAVDQMLGSGYH
jgi:hypothetical protein